MLTILDDFLTNHSPNTARCYIAAWEQWAAFKGSEKLEATTDRALSFVSSLRKRGLSDNTIKNRFDSLNSIYGFLLDLGKVKHNPFKAVKRAISWRQRIQVRPTKIIPFDTVRSILRAPDESTKSGVRDSAMLAVWFGCGLRRSELRMLNVGSILVGAYRDKSGRESYALELERTKAGKIQQQPIREWAWPTISRLIVQRKADGGGNNSPLLCFYFADGTSREKRLSESSVYRMYRSYTGGAPHSARVTFATKLHEQGASIDDIRRSLRHRTSSQVETYLRRKDDIAENPAGKIKF